MKEVTIGNLNLSNGVAFVCTVLEDSAVGVIKTTQQAIAKGTDVIELRLDKLKDSRNIARIGERITIPTIAVCRPKEWGGCLALSNKKRAERLTMALESGVKAVDIELYTGKELRNQLVERARQRGITVMLSYENFQETPSEGELLHILKEEEVLGADICKIAVAACNYEDMLRVLNVTVAAKKALNVPFVTLAMGDYGRLSRVLSLLFGASLTYCSCQKGKEGAPGQLPLEETKRLYTMLLKLGPIYGIPTIVAGKE